MFLKNKAKRRETSRLFYCYLFEIYDFCQFFYRTQKITFKQFFENKGVIFITIEKAERSKNMAQKKILRRNLRYFLMKPNCEERKCMQKKQKR
jgi:hypothetical protein